MMDAADAIIANLTPFRGPSADAGTVYELGYMAGRRKFCLAYSNDPTLYVERVKRFARLRNLADGQLTDKDGLTVENFGWPDNLNDDHTLDLHVTGLTPRQAPSDICTSSPRSRPVSWLAGRSRRR